MALSSSIFDKIPIVPVLVGNILEWYDFSLLATFGLFAAGFLMRPIGSLVFGYYGDKIGRPKKTLVLVLILIAVPRMLIGLLLIYSQIGIFAPLSLLLCRLSH